MKHPQITKLSVFNTVSPVQMITTLKVHHKALRAQASNMTERLVLLEHKHASDDVSEHLLSLNSVWNSIELSEQTVRKSVEQINITKKIEHTLRIALLETYYDIVVMGTLSSVLDEIADFVRFQEQAPITKPTDEGLVRQDDEVLCTDIELVKYLPSAFGVVIGFIGNNAAVRFGTGLISKVFEVPVNRLVPLRTEEYFADTTAKHEPSVEPKSSSQVKTLEELGWEKGAESFVGKDKFSIFYNRPLRLDSVELTSQSIEISKDMVFVAQFTEELEFTKIGLSQDDLLAIVAKMSSFTS